MQSLLFFSFSNFDLIFVLLESFCGCCSDMGICCYGFWCPACLFGSNSSKINGTSCIMMCCIYMALMNSGLSWIPHYFMREKLRRVHGLEEDRLCTDIPATFCYAQCALCQEAREMKSRGEKSSSRRKKRIFTRFTLLFFYYSCLRSFQSYTTEFCSKNSTNDATITQKSLISMDF